MSIKSYTKYPVLVAKIMKVDLLAEAMSAFGTPASLYGENVVSYSVRTETEAAIPIKRAWKIEATVLCHSHELGLLALLTRAGSQTEDTHLISVKVKVLITVIAGKLI
jgi:hypothetical protein